MPWLSSAIQENKTFLEFGINRHHEAPRPSAPNGRSYDFSHSMYEWFGRGLGFLPGITTETLADPFHRGLSYQ